MGEYRIELKNLEDQKLEEKNEALQLQIKRLKEDLNDKKQECCEHICEIEKVKEINNEAEEDMEYLREEIKEKDELIEELNN
jgi:hypothetical protein